MTHDDSTINDSAVDAARKLPRAFPDYMVHEELDALRALAPSFAELGAGSISVVFADGLISVPWPDALDAIFERADRERGHFDSDGPNYEGIRQELRWAIKVLASASVAGMWVAIHRSAGALEDPATPLGVDVQLISDLVVGPALGRLVHLIRTGPDAGGSEAADAPTDATKSPPPMARSRSAAASVLRSVRDELLVAASGRQTRTGSTGRYARPAVRFTVRDDGDIRTQVPLELS